MSNGTAWVGAVVGSIVGSAVTAFVTGDDQVRTNLTFAVPFILLASIGAIKLLSEPPPSTTEVIKLVPFNEIS